MARLPRIAELDASASGAGYFLCVRKERRTGRGGPFLAMHLQDASGEIGAKLFQDVESAENLFEAGDFVAVQAKGNLFNQRLELVIERIRRVTAEDEKLGFREEDCIRCAPRPIEAMWQELCARIDSVGDPHIRGLLSRLVARHGDRLRIWPAARQMHHAYRGGLLEHVLKIAEVGALLADSYGARRDLVIAGAIVHDIGKLDELTYAGTIEYSLAGNLVGHIVMGAAMVREEIRSMPEFPPELALEIEHLILSHHGAKELGSPVVPLTVEALILSAVDDFDATMQQVRQHLSSDDGDGRFTSYHRNLERVLLKPPAV
ncbi:MAG: HD domain-containing protein [Acidobacteria bacterium]|nr:HD domain-containing protein [Acidobacteriota bacterium]